MRPFKLARLSHFVLLLIAVAIVTTNPAALPTASAQEDDFADAEKDQAKENRDLFANFLHHAVLGKFSRADAYAQSLLDNNPDPIEILKYADQYTNSIKTLILLVSKVQVSDSARQVLDLIREGELLQRKDPQRIKLNIEKLGGDPQTEFNAINRLRESGEYAVPWLTSTLQDDTKSKLHSRIIHMLPKMGKDAVNPLVIALKMADNNTKQFIVRALGEIGYPQALPYLLTVLEEPKSAPELTAMVDSAIARIISSTPSLPAISASEAFLDLARQYYADHGSVKADPRFEFANVWFWRDGRLQRTEVPRRIFNEVMAMRCAEQALRLQPDETKAEVVAIWLAANIRREAELGMNVESVDSDPAALADPTKAEDFPRSAYFARAAGARYCHMVLDMAVRDREPAVALGAIAALRLIAGARAAGPTGSAGNLVGSGQQVQPLAQALNFPDLVVRLKAALALAHALPTSSFVRSDRVVPTLAEALAQTGGQYYLVIEPDQANRNRVMDALRADRATAIGEADLYTGLERARQELATISAIVLATDVSGPEVSTAVSTIRSNHLYAMTPIILLSKQGQAEQAEALAEMDSAITSIPANATPQEVRQMWQRAARATGQTALLPDQALTLALDATAALRRIAISRSPVFNANVAEAGLIRAMGGDEETLQIAAASVLALLEGETAQQAIAKVALDAGNSQSLRVAVFDSLAESAKVNGNLLSENQVIVLIELAINEPNLIIRSAASQALGALNLPSSKVIPIIDKYHRG